MIHLFVKQHEISGLKYFGKTAVKNPYFYKGSGKHWIRHINKYGRKHVATLQVWTFDNQDEAREFAIKFSKENDIVNSNEWANLMEEDALCGCPVGYKWTPERRAARRLLLTDQKIRAKISDGLKRSMTVERREEISKSKKGIPLKEEHARKIKESIVNRSAEEKLITAEKKSKALKGRSLSAEELLNRSIAAQQSERCEKISKALRGRKQSPELIEKRRKSILEAMKRKSTIETR